MALESSKETGIQAAVGIQARTSATRPGGLLQKYSTCTAAPRKHSSTSLFAAQKLAGKKTGPCRAISFSFWGVFK